MAKAASRSRPSGCWHQIAIGSEDGGIGGPPGVTALLECIPSASFFIAGALILSIVAAKLPHLSS
ncbi:hypothetical protein ACVJBD_000394 [Rhizobium mongolense]